MSSTEEERAIQRMFVDPSWCPCDPSRWDENIEAMHNGNDLWLKAIFRHVFPHWTSHHDASTISECCQKNIKTWAAAQQWTTLMDQPVYFWLRALFEHSSPRLISQWILLDQFTSLLPPIHSEVYAILLRRWIDTEPSPDSLTWLIHILSRLREEHLHWKPLKWPSTWSTSHQDVCRQAMTYLQNEPLEIHPKLVPIVMQRLQRMSA